MRSSLASIEDLGDGRFRVYVSVGYDQKTGKRRRQSQVVRGSLRDAERVKMRMLMSAGRAGASSLSLDEFMTEVWLPTKDGLRRHTLEGYGWMIDGYIKPYIGHLPLKAVDSYVVERWMADLTRDGKSPQTVRNARSVLKNAMRAAVRWRHIDRDPTDGVSLPAVDYTPKVLTEQQMNDYLDAFSGHIIEPYVVLAIATGMRRSEYAALEWSDIDFDAKKVTVRRGLHQNGSETWYDEPKSKTSRRDLGLPEWALDALRPLRAVGPLVSFRNGPMPPATIAHLYRARVEEAELPYVPMRDLRNSHGTYLYEKGVDIAHIADKLGHSGTEITRKHYVVRKHDNVERTTLAAVEALRVCQSVPNAVEVSPPSPSQTVVGE